MSMGASDSLQQIVFFTPQQQRVAGEIADILNRVMRGSLGARNNPSAAIPPAGDAPGVRDASPGLGATLDILA